MTKLKVNLGQFTLIIVLFSAIMGINIIEKIEEVELDGSTQVSDYFLTVTDYFIDNPHSPGYLRWQGWPRAGHCLGM